MKETMFFELLSGNIASGKSTWTAIRAKQGALVANDDAMITALHGGTYCLYDKNLKKLYKAMEAMVLHMGAAVRRDVIIDRTNMTVSSRARYVQLAKSIDVPIVCVKFPIEAPEIHAGRRFNSDPRGHTYEKWLKVAQDMQASYEVPKLCEGFDLVVDLAIAQEMNNENTWTSMSGPEGK